MHWALVVGGDIGDGGATDVAAHTEILVIRTYACMHEFECTVGRGAGLVGFSIGIAGVFLLLPTLKHAIYPSSRPQV